tara:strand:+ start:112 stop:585 length:474 start_codon:yes stop_codon:yes gene_type:complete
MKNLTPIEIANKINKLANINLFADTRKEEIIIHRSLLTFILRSKLKMRWIAIALFYNSQGKSMDHANAMNSYKQYAGYKKKHKKLAKLEKLFTFKSDLIYDEINEIHYLKNKVSRLENKFTKNPLIQAVKKIPKEKQKEAAERIELLIQSWSWKQKA